MEHEDILQVAGINSKGFGTIPKLVMQDKNLSISAKAIYAYFCSYAGAGKQAFPQVSRIIKDLGISKNNYYKHFNQLRDCGYIKAEQVHKAGRLSHNVYTLCESIQSTKFCDTVQCTKKQDTVKRDTVFCDTRNINSSKNKQNLKITYPPIPPQGDAARLSERTTANFETFWSAYPRREGKGAANKEWMRVNPTNEDLTLMLEAIKSSLRSAQWQRENGRYIPAPAKWLKQERWLDKPDSAISKSSSYDLNEVENFMNSGFFNRATQ